METIFLTLSLVFVNKVVNDVSVLVIYYYLSGHLRGPMSQVHYVPPPWVQSHLCLSPVLIGSNNRHRIGWN